MSFEHQRIQIELTFDTAWNAGGTYYEARDRAIDAILTIIERISE